MERKNSPNSFQLDTASLSSPKTQQHQQEGFDQGTHGKQSWNGPTNPYGLRLPLSPTDNVMSTTSSPVIESFMPTTGNSSLDNMMGSTAGTRMADFISTTGSSGGHTFMPMTNADSVFDSDLYQLLPQPDTQYGTVQPAWMYDGHQPPWSNTHAADVMGATLAPELPRLDTQLPQEGGRTYETFFGQPTPPSDEEKSKISAKSASGNRSDSLGTVISPSCLEVNERRSSRAKPRKNSVAFTQQNDLSPTTAKPRRQRKAHGRKASAVSVESEEDDKREASLARNRIAASKCRDKKKKWTANLEERERSLRMENKILHAHKAALTNELLLLKNKALDHKDCECDPVREYLMLSAREKIEEKKQLERMEELKMQLKIKEEAHEPVGGQFGRRPSDSSDSSGQGEQQPLHSRSNSFHFGLSPDGHDNPFN